MSKWGFLLLHNDESLWVIGTSPSHVKARKRTPPFLCCVSKHSVTVWFKSAQVKGKNNSFHQPSTECFKQQAHFIFSFVAVKIVTLSLVILCKCSRHGWLWSNSPNILVTLHFPSQLAQKFNFINCCVELHMSISRYHKPNNKFCWWRK